MEFLRIVRLHLSDVTTPASHPLPNTLIPIYAYIVHSPSGVLLFDSGVGPPHDVIDALYRPRRSPLLDLLARAGVAIRDVDVVVNSHLHFDHCGGNQLFPHARIIVQRVELEVARTSMYTVREWVDFEGARLDIIDGEHSIWDDARVVPTPGHTRGHQSLVLETPEGRVILAGQAAETAAGFEEGTGGWSLELAELGAASVAKLKAFSPSRVLFAHDEIEWGPGLVTAVRVEERRPV